MSIRRQPTTNPMTSRRYRRTSTQHRHHQKRPRAVKVRNVAGLSYTTSSAFIFSSSRRFWASNSAIAALVDTGSLVYLIAALWCRSKLALTPAPPPRRGQARWRGPPYRRSRHAAPPPRARPGSPSSWSARRSLSSGPCALLWEHLPFAGPIGRHGLSLPSRYTPYPLSAPVRSPTVRTRPLSPL